MVVDTMTEQRNIPGTALYESEQRAVNIEKGMVLFFTETGAHKKSCLATAFRG